MRLDNSYKLRRALVAYKDSSSGLRRVQAAAMLLYHSKGPGAHRAREIYFHAQRLLDTLTNKSIARVVRPG